MDAMVSSVYKRGSLPKLSTSKELSRRDSQSSSRTRDSGYNSDLEVAFSPLDFIDSDQHFLLAPPPLIPGTFVGSNLASFKTLRRLENVSTSQRQSITSNPATASIHIKEGKPESRSGISRGLHLESGPSVQDNDIEKWIKDNLPSRNGPKERVSSIVSLSSATSGEMYTDTDISDDELGAGIDARSYALSRSTTKTIDIVMRKIEINLRYAAHVQCNGGNSSTATNNSAPRSQENNRKASHSSGKRKSRSEDNLPSNDDQDDGSSKRRRGSLATVESSETGARFACPFYKHEPHRFRNRRTCPGPGWPTVHRMKEHLYRAHAQSIYCPRCYAMFDADVDLSNHLRSAQCQVSAPQPIEGIDRETLKALRKRSPALRLEEDKWRDVYHLLFPDVALEDIPSPFYDSDSPSEESRRFRRELLRRVQHELVNTAGQLSGPVEQQLLRQVAQIIRRCEDDLLSSFDTSSMIVPSLVNRRASDTSTASTLSTQPTPSSTAPIPTHPRVSRLTTSFPPPVPNAMDSAAWQEQLGRTQRATEQQGQIGPGPWDQPSTQTPSSEWIDWDAIFPPPNSACNEAFTGFSMPMWTQ